MEGGGRDLREGDVTLPADHGGMETYLPLLRPSEGLGASLAARAVRGLSRVQGGVRADDRGERVQVPRIERID